MGIIKNTHDTIQYKYFYFLRIHQRLIFANVITSYVVLDGDFE